MSNIEYYTTSMRGGARAGNVTFYDRLERGRERSQPVERFGYISGMVETAENLARDYQITREECDAFSAESHARAARARQEGRYDYRGQGRREGQVGGAKRLGRLLGSRYLTGLRELYLQGNYLGTDLTGTNTLGNGLYGIATVNELFLPIRRLRAVLPEPPLWGGVGTSRSSGFPIPPGSLPSDPTPPTPLLPCPQTSYASR